MQIVLICVKRADRKREDASWVCDRRGWRTGKEWETTPERLHGEPAAPSQHSSSLPVCFAMVTRQGSRCSQLMCFSVAGASGVLMCLSLSPTQSMSTVLGCTNTRRADDRRTLGHPECGKPAWRFTWKVLPENLPSPFGLYAVWNLSDRKWVFLSYLFDLYDKKLTHTVFPFYWHISRWLK